MTPKILLVGTGITTALTSICLNKTLSEVCIVIWDKARGIGGRMSTSRPKSSSENNSTVDLGAQYITSTNETISANYDIYESLLTEKILEPMKCTILGMKPQKENVKNFIAAKGSSSIVKHFLQKSDNNICFNHHINSISKLGKKWVVTTTLGTKDEFDIVILTMPIPQILQLQGSIKDILLNEPDVLNKLESVSYYSRYALGLFYDNNSLKDIKWDAQYFVDDPVFRYIAIDNKKRQVKNIPDTVVIHTTKEFGQQYLEEALPNMESKLMTCFKERFPSWPEPNSVKCHKWRYSQVSNSYPGSPGFITISEDPILIAGGDGFRGSTFDNCVFSAKSITREIQKLVGQNKS
uniref:Amine oxidase domain-containing protein n=1 Tax=Clastoptera arizonana TaxID=38151 RepID=A0A1B6CIQ7_9HEMI